MEMLSGFGCKSDAPSFPKLRKYFQLKIAIKLMIWINIYKPNGE